MVAASNGEAIIEVANEEDLKKEHYKNVAAVYDRQVFYDTSGPLVQWQKNLVQTHLALKPADRLVDIGGGTGGFTELLARAVDATDSQMTVCEPSAEMLAVAAQRKAPSLETVHADARGFASLGKTCEKILLKEVMHHIPVEERTDTFKELASVLSPGGRLLVLTRPHRPQYPFFAAAMETWAAGQEEYAEFKHAMEEAGFTVQVFEERFPMCIRKSTWYDMIRTRWWSHFHAFSDAELEDGIQELEASFPDQEELSFDEVEIFLVASTDRKNPECYCTIA